jgi:hypothetical protein
VSSYGESVDSVDGGGIFAGGKPAGKSCSLVFTGSSPNRYRTLAQGPFQKYKTGIIENIMNITETQKATQDVLAPFHFSSLEDAALTFLHLSSLAKLSEYRRDDQHFRERYGMSFESFKKKVDKKMNEESFEEEDDYMAWQ